MLDEILDLSKKWKTVPLREYLHALKAVQYLNQFFMFYLFYHEFHMLFIGIVYKTKLNKHKNKILCNN